MARWTVQGPYGDYEVVDAQELVTIFLEDAKERRLACPICETPLRVERRGPDWFAWCCSGPWGNGCSGMAAFGETRDAAIDAVRAVFVTL